jgi:hypothetical protein
MEYEQHRGEIVQCLVSGPRRPGFKTTPEKKLRQLNAGIVFYYPLQISLIILTFDVIQLTLHTAHLINSYINNK